MTFSTWLTVFLSTTVRVILGNHDIHPESPSWTLWSLHSLVSTDWVIFSSSPPQLPTFMVVFYIFANSYLNQWLCHLRNAKQFHSLAAPSFHREPSSLQQLWPHWDAQSIVPSSFLPPSSSLPQTHTLSSSSLFSSGYLISTISTLLCMFNSCTPFIYISHQPGKTWTLINLAIHLLCVYTQPSNTTGKRTS